VTAGTQSTGGRSSLQGAKPCSSGEICGRTFQGDHKAGLVVILPKNRLWEWHRQLILHLEEKYDIAVFLDETVRPYQCAERLWLKLERLIFSSGALARPIAPDRGWRPVLDLDDVSDRIVINLSERSQSYVRMLELRYGGVLDSRALIGTLLRQSAPYLDVRCPIQDRILAASKIAIEDKFLIGGGLQAAFARCLSLIDRALSSTGHDAPIEVGAVTVLERMSLTGFILRMLAHKATSLMMRAYRRQEHWQVALRYGGQSFNVVQDDGDRFYADPFLYRTNERTFLFVEEYPYAEGKGLISAAEVVGDKLLATPVPVLERPYHLSYPFVFECEAEFWMIPESGENRTVELYRATEFPWKWTLSKVLLEGAVFSDATILFHKGLWWLFVTVDWIGNATQDELSIFYSETLHGEWKPHQANPVKSDSRFSRPAGRIIQKNGRLFRPAQDCDRTYGAGIVWFEITELTTTRFSERKIAHWDGQAELFMEGFHSFDQLGPLQVIDFKCSVYRGSARRNIVTMKPRHGGSFERSFSKSAHDLQLEKFDQFTSS